MEYANEYHENMSVMLTPVELMPPAPGEDCHPSLALANSSGRQDDPTEADLLSTPEGATWWMMKRALVSAGIELYEPCNDILREFRRSVREVLGAATADMRPDDRAMTAINRAMAQIPSVRLLAWDGPTGFHRQQKYAETQAVEHALAAIAADVVDLLTGDDATKLSQCAAPGCGRFMLRTHARRHWCSTRCGDRVRAARAYAKKTATDTSVSSAR